MAAYSAKFKFTNNTGFTILSGTVSHAAANFATVSIDLAGLPTGEESVTKAFSTESTSIDHWSIGFQIKDGASTYRYRTEHGCAVDHEDAGGTVALDVTLPATGHDGTFNMSPPHSGGCSTGVDGEIV